MNTRSRSEPTPGPDTWRRAPGVQASASQPGFLLSCRLRLWAFRAVYAAALQPAVALLPGAAHAQAVEAWVQRVGGPGQNANSPALVLDASGNVIVTGASYGGEPLPAYCDDWVTTKYSGAGLPLWTNRYDGPANSQDWPNAVAVDASGNVFVTGFAWFTANPGDYPHCTTTKYSPSGEVLWTRHVQSWSGGGKALAVDSHGDVVVTYQPPWNGSNHDALTVKYSSAGALLWSKRYSGPANADDTPVAVATDADGNVVSVATSSGSSGTSCATIKYSSTGVPLWTNRYANLSGYGSVLAVDRGGNVLVTGTAYVPWISTHDFLTIKYSSDGLLVWTNRYDGLAKGSDYANAVAVDASGNVFVTGESEVSGTIADYATIQYTSSGVPVWTNLYNGPGNWLDHPTALAVDAGGNVFVTGGSGPGWATVAYSGSGVSLWTNHYSGPGDFGGWPSAIAVDGSGGVYVTGASGVPSDGNPKFDFATVKYVIPPIIARQPLSCTNAVGTTASFSVEAAGGTPLSYQWRKGEADLVDAGNISGVTTPNLVIADVQLTDAGGYSVVLTNAYGRATSVVAQLTVVVPPSGGRLTNLSYSPETGFSFIFRDGTVGKPYRIQVSPSLGGGWQDWQSFNYIGPVGFADLGAVETTNRFYRAISP